MESPRRLAAIMFTDLVDFTARSQRDESGTLRILSEHRSLVRPIFTRFHGREVKTTGDGFLVEFESALDATLCAVEIQSRSEAWRKEAGGDRPWVRIAVHVGDVVPEGDDILGDAVNVASRLEAFADPGGICVSGAVFQQVVNKVTHRFEKVPTPVLKGVTAPIEAYRLVRAGAEVGPAFRASSSNRIAVLPLASISPDPHDEYLAEGLTDELIHGLSQGGGLKVIARTSVDHYRGRGKPLPQIGHELNVGSILEGSVRRSGNRIRVTIQLVDVGSQEPIWAQQYDRELDDVFAIQTDISVHVAGTLRASGSRTPEGLRSARPPGTPASYRAYLKGRTELHGLTVENCERAIAHFEEALRLDATNSRAYAGLADATYLRALVAGEPFAAVVKALERSRELTTKSIALEPNAAEAHTSLGHCLDELMEYPGAERELRTAIALNPAYALAHRWLARLLTEKGRLEEAVVELELAEEADPLSPDVQSILTRTLLAIGRSDEARAKMHRLAELEPDGMRLHYARFEAALRESNGPDLLREAQWFSVHAPHGSSVDREAYWMGLYYARIGAQERAQRSIATLRAAREPETDLPLAWATEQIAEIHANLGELDACFHLLDEALITRALPLEHWSLCASFEGVRRDPRFGSFLEKLHLA